MQKENLTIKYNFIFDNGFEKEFILNIDQDLILINKYDSDYPEWTKFKNFKCPNCPLNKLDDDYCPVATNLKNVISFFSKAASFEKVFLKIQTKERTYSKFTSLQDGVSALIGVLMVTSGCPIMGKLRPMVRFHLPFSSLEETQYRAMSMYMLGQYFIYKKGQKPDWDMKNLLKIYEDIKILNQNVCRRIADLESKDTSINAVVVLNNFAEYVTFTLDDQSLEEMENLYKDFFKD